MSGTHHQLWRTCGSGSMIHSAGEQQLCERHLRAAVLFEQQQVVHVLGFLLTVNWSLFGSSTNSQESSMIWFRLQHSHLVASWSGWCTCDPPMATGAKQSPLSAFTVLFWRLKGLSVTKVECYSLLDAEGALQSHRWQQELVLFDKQKHLSGAASQHPAIAAAAKMQTSAHSEPRACTLIIEEIKYKYDRSVQHLTLGIPLSPLPISPFIYPQREGHGHLL